MLPHKSPSPDLGDVGPLQNRSNIFSLSGVPGEGNLAGVPRHPRANPLAVSGSVNSPASIPNVRFGSKAVMSLATADQVMRGAFQTSGG